METLPPAENTAGRQAAADLQRLLRDLGMPEDRLRRVARWANLDETEEYVYVPPLPLAVAERLVRLLPPGARS